MSKAIEKSLLMFRFLTFVRNDKKIFEKIRTIPACGRQACQTLNTPKVPLRLRSAAMLEVILF